MKGENQEKKGQYSAGDNDDRLDIKKSVFEVNRELREQKQREEEEKQAELNRRIEEREKKRQEEYERRILGDGRTCENVFLEKNRQLLLSQ